MYSTFWKLTDALYGGFVSSLRLTFWTTMSTSSADGFVRNVSSTRLCSFWAIVASASAGSRKNSESGYSRWTVARSRLKCFTMNCVRKYRSSGACGWYAVASYCTASARPTSSIRMTSGLTCEYFAAVWKLSAEQPEGDERDEHQGDLQVRVHHQRGAVQLHELALGVLQRLGIQVGDRGAHGRPSSARARAAQTAATRSTPMPTTSPSRIAMPIADDSRRSRTPDLDFVRLSQVIGNVGESSWHASSSRYRSEQIAARTRSWSARRWPEKIEFVSDGTSTMPTQNVDDHGDRLQGVDPVLGLT